MYLASGKVLLLQRSAGSDHPGTWGFPGGKIEDDDADAEAAAIRESQEEIGYQPAREGIFVHARQSKENVDFTTFVHKTDEEFKPTLNEEHGAYVWADLNELPPNLHPGVKMAIDKLGWNELDVAKAIRDGELTSPQRYANVWLFDMRITGTGAAYRSGAKEFAWRDPSLYLNDEFLERCNGLPVIWEHPEASMLNSEEFSRRVVGTIVVPYIKGQDVWGVAKIYDDETATVMLTKQMSTSPAVVLKGGDSVKVPMEDGSVILVEGKPALLDHLAICEQGVWDKLQAPSGVNTDFGGQRMADDTHEAKEKEAEAAELKAEAKKMEAKEDKKDAAVEEKKADADGGQLLDKVLAKLDAMCARMDAFDKKEVEKPDAKKDEDEAGDVKAKELAADKAKKDADEEDDKKEEKKADKAKKDADEDEKKADMARQDAEDRATLRRRLDEMERKIPKELSDKDYSDMAEAQAKADSVFHAFGDRAPRPLQGEDLTGYRKRLAKGLQKHSDRWSNIDLGTLHQDALSIAEADIYREAAIVARNPVDLAAGTLREIVQNDRFTGLRTSTFVGKNTFITGMKPPAPRARLSLARKDH